MGGYDATGNLKAAGQTYRQGTNDFFAGPLNNLASFPDVTSQTCQKYDRIWRVTKDEVIAFKETGIATRDIREWPGNGDASNGELEQLAPFEDLDGDGIYGGNDYPRYNFSGFPNDPNNPGRLLCDGYIYGDKTLFWVFNDVVLNHNTVYSTPCTYLPNHNTVYSTPCTHLLNHNTVYSTPCTHLLNHNIVLCTPCIHFLNRNIVHCTSCTHLPNLNTAYCTPCTHFTNHNAVHCTPCTYFTSH